MQQKNLNGARNLTQQDFQTPSHFANEEAELLFHSKFVFETFIVVHSLQRKVPLCNLGEWQTITQEVFSKSYNSIYSSSTSLSTWKIAPKTIAEAQKSERTNQSSQEQVGQRARPQKSIDLTLFSSKSAGLLAPQLVPTRLATTSIVIPGKSAMGPKRPVETNYSHPELKSTDTYNSSHTSTSVTRLTTVEFQRLIPVSSEGDLALIPPVRPLQCKMKLSKQKKPQSKTPSMETDDTDSAFNSSRKHKDIHRGNLSDIC